MMKHTYFRYLDIKGYFKIVMEHLTITADKPHGFTDVSTYFIHSLYKYY